LEILHNYTHIQQSRFGNALHVEINIPDDIKRTKKIVPLALQLLVENAMKHNIVSQSQPLKIIITATHTELTIRNNIQPKISKEKGVGLGLANIKKRYALATEKQISYGAEGKDYVVNIPLL
jgi:LytS/YehU family sensor histidine kinase